MAAIQIPEQKVRQVVDYVLDFLREDYETATDKEESYLFLLFGQYKDDSSYDYWTNAVALFTRGTDEPRHIETHFFLNRTRFSLPTVHITISSDNTGPDGLGFDQGWQESEFDSSTSLNFRQISSREFNTRFQIVLTSDNTFEVLMMYHAIQACLVGNNHLLFLNGLQNPSLKGGDIILNDQQAPQGIYARAIFLDCFYTLSAPSFEKERAVTDVILEGIMDVNLQK